MNPGKLSLPQSIRNPLRKASAKVRLSPLPGRRLPHEIRPEYVGRLAEAFADGVRDEAFERLVHRIDAGPIHRGNQVKIFFNGEETFVAVLDAIDQATSEILLETYILRDDNTGHELVERLGRAAARGVKVRVLADAFGSWTTSHAFWRQMQRKGIEARLFHPLWVKLWDHLFATIERSSWLTSGWPLRAG